MKSPTTLHQLSSSGLPQKLLTILKKYCNAEYGFDTSSSRSGKFQYYLVKLMVWVAGCEYSSMLELMQGSAVEWLTQIMEEAIIIAHEKALEGVIENIDDTSYLYRFLHLALQFIDLTVSRNFTEYIPSVRDNLKKVSLRFEKLTTKKEANPLIQLFTIVEPFPSGLDTLKEISESLYQYRH
jgi:hypothetical protein